MTRSILPPAPCAPLLMHAVNTLSARMAGFVRPSMHHRAMSLRGLVGWMCAVGLSQAALAQTAQTAHTAPTAPAGVYAQPTTSQGPAAAGRAAALAASAPDESAQSLPTVQTSLQRGSFMPYKQINQVLLALKTDGEGLFISRLRIRPNDKSQPLPPNIRLALMTDERTINIPVDAEGRFDLPTFPKEEAKDMELGSNVPKGTTGIQLRIDLTTPPDRLDMATVRRVVKVGQHLRDELLPWYVRWLVPQIDGVTVCSARPDWQLGWAENGQNWVLPLSADASAKEPDTEKDKPSRPCTVLTGQEQFPDHARLLSPAADQPKLYIRLRQTRPS